MRHLNIVWGRCLFCLLLMSTPEVIATADAPADIELLKLVVGGIRANHESLRSWVGRAHIEDTRHTDADVAPTATVLVDFAYDALDQKLRWNFDVRGHNKAEGTASYKSSQMIKDNELHRFGPYSNRAAETRPVVIITPADTKRVEGLADEFHPMYFLEATRGGENIADFIARCHDDLAKRGTDSVTITRSGQEVILTFIRAEGFGGSKYVFDARHAYNLTKYESHDTLVGVQWTFTFAHFEDVSLPIRWTYKHYSFEGAEKRNTFSRDVRFLDHKVNLPIPPSEFTLQRMGVQAGDFVDDKIREIVYQPLSQSPANGTLSKPHGVLWRFGVGLAALVVVSTLAYFVYRWPRSNSS
jgi:hypothetical protein